MKVTIFFLMAVALGSSLALAQELEAVRSSDQQAPASGEELYPIDKSSTGAPDTEAATPIGDVRNVRPASSQPTSAPLPPFSSVRFRTPAAGSELSFLKPGKDYHIRFREGMGIFDQHPEYIRNQPFLPTPVVQVLEVSNGSWAYLKYPTEPTDYAKWNKKRKALAQAITDKKCLIIGVRKENGTVERLSNDISKSTDATGLAEKVVIQSLETARLKASENIKKRITQCQEELTGINTTQVWVNLDNAISISELWIGIKDMPAVIDHGKHPHPEAAFVRQF